MSIPSTQRKLYNSIAQHCSRLLLPSCARAGWRGRLRTCPASVRSSFGRNETIEWLLCYDISEGFQQNKEEDPRRQEDAALLAALYDNYGTGPFKSADVHFICGNVSSHRRAPHLHPTKPTPQEEELHAAIETAIGSKDITAKRIGQWAKRVDGAYIENYKLDLHHNRSSNSNEMKVGCPTAPTSNHHTVQSRAGSPATSAALSPPCASPFAVRRFDGYVYGCRAMAGVRSELTPAFGRLL